MVHPLNEQVSVSVSEGAFARKGSPAKKSAQPPKPDSDRWPRRSLPHIWLRLGGDDASIAKFRYAYQADENNIDKKYFDHRGANSYNEYTYDELDRVDCADYLADGGTPDHEESFVMDNLGNRDGDQTLAEGTVNFTVQPSTNHYTSIGGNSISHDDAGNLTADTDGYKYFYDQACPGMSLAGENRIVKIEDSSSTDVATFDYDALDRRIRKSDQSAQSVVLYDYNPDWQVLVEYDGAGELKGVF